MPSPGRTAPRQAPHKSFPRSGGMRETGRQQIRLTILRTDKATIRSHQRTKETLEARRMRLVFRDDFEAGHDVRVHLWPLLEEACDGDEG
ncbi:unnamed protein product [Clonostachys rhizophaga]|uniref:Uncharacterized protein n=1 Tax=Clonostachys rhizophaga TaxID=160324 RepID=A0A9N9V6M4_9HYPO|nr:unnamed protein product [Clonostachys rhizophaga]